MVCHLLPRGGHPAEDVDINGGVAATEEKMAKQTYSLTYEGYWLYRDRSSIPNRSGVYSVYACTYDPHANTVSIRMLIYIGESGTVGNRIGDHEKLRDWQKHLLPGERLCFSFAPVATASRERAEAALIYHHKPPENVEYVDNFPFDETTVTTSGRNAELARRFTVYRTKVRTAWHRAL